MKAPPIPKISLPNRRVGNEFAIAVTRLPTAVKTVETNPMSLMPYLSTINPAGNARKIPGITTILINNPAWAELEMLNSCIMEAIRGGTA